MNRKELASKLLRAARGQSPSSTALSDVNVNVVDSLTLGSSSSGGGSSKKQDSSSSSSLASRRKVGVGGGITTCPGSTSTTPPPLPCFPLKRHHFGRVGSSGTTNTTSTTSNDNDDSVNDGATTHHHNTVVTPSDFHSHLCTKIRNARERVILASLYIGVGSKISISTINTNNDANANNDASSSSSSSCKEDEFLDALQHAASNPNVKKIQVLLDANRAMRTVSLTQPSKLQFHRDGDHGSHGDDHDNNINISSNHNHHNPIFKTNNNVRTNSAEAVFSRLEPHLSTTASTSNDNNDNNNDINNHNDDDSLNDWNSSGLFLFPVNDKRLSTILPSPLDEVVGVFHIKAYIIDDELILSGANLSEEYFSNRVDRYMSFINGGGGLVEFYAELCNILSFYAIRYQGRAMNNDNNDMTISSIFATKDEDDRKQILQDSLKKLFDGEINDRKQMQNSNDWERKDPKTNSPSSSSSVIAHAIPTFQISNNFFHGGQLLPFPSDEEATLALIRTSIENDPSASIRLSSAYLNLTPRMLSVLTMFGNRKNLQTKLGVPYILTAGLTSHGFAPKKGAPTRSTGIVDKIKASIPDAFLTLVQDAARSIIACGGSVLMYERLGWTFHAKGIWITSNPDDSNDVEGSCNKKYHGKTRELIHDSSSLVSTIIGSSNYGARSYDLDVESNCILIFNELDNEKDANSGSNTVKEHVSAEWNDLCKSCFELKDTYHADGRSSIVQVIAQFMKRFL